MTTIAIERIAFVPGLFKLPSSQHGWLNLL